MTDHQVPDGSLVLHIGPQKTGSTAIQMSFHESREEISAQGVGYPGDTMRPQEAGWAALGGAAVGRQIPPIEVWDAFAAEVRADPHPRVFVSNEDFGRADDTVVARIIDGLGAENTHLVFVARRLDKMLPSHWQERVKARMTRTYDEFLHHVLETPDADWEATVTWEPHDVGAVIDRWSKHLPVERITVIVSDEVDRTVIPSGFENLLGLSPGTLKPSKVNTNTSLTFTQTEALRRVNRLAIEESWTPEQYWRIVQTGVVRALRNSTTVEKSGPKITGLPAWAHPLVAERARAQVAAIADRGVNVIGDPSRLLVDAEPAELPPLPDAIPLDMVADLVSGAVHGSETLHRRRLRAGLRAARKAGSAEQLSGRELVKIIGSKASKKLRRRG